MKILAFLVLASTQGEYVSINKLTTYDFTVVHDNVVGSYRIQQGNFSLVVLMNSPYYLLNGFLKEAQNNVVLINGGAAVKKSILPSALFLNKTISVPVVDQTNSLKSSYVPSIRSPRSIYRNYKVVIDAGHGGSQTGTMNPRLSIVEKDMTLSVADMVEKELKALGFNVHMTRDSDRTVSLGERVRFANLLKPHVFVSIHGNYSRESSVNGFEVFTRKGGRSKKSVLLAKHISNRFARGTDIPNRGVKHKNFYVLKNTVCPAVLVEVDFLSNDNSARNLKDNTYKEKIAGLIVDGIQDYFDAGL